MKVPDLASFDDAGMSAWNGTIDVLKEAAAHAQLKFAHLDLSKAHDKASLFGQIDRALALPEHFGHNWDALADVLEDRDWLGKRGRAILLSHSAPYRKDHPTEWATLEDILREAVEFWKERHVPFWVFFA